MNNRAIVGLTIIAALLMSPRPPRAAQDGAQRGPDIALQPTRHPRVPADLSLLWLAPTSRTRTPEMTALANAVSLELDSNFTRALQVLAEPATRQGALGPYAVYYQGIAELRLNRAADARRTFQTLRASPLDGYLAEAAALREGEADEALGDNRAALDVYERLSATKTSVPEDVLMRVGHAARVT